jgi:uncharacterized protein YyaL (SSP411 family)
MESTAPHASTNRLANETSPYLLQHQHNPVDWYPWGPEALAAARAQDKPIFLSVGYSTCYWCHVMERESFENPAVAAEMNARFICIKVDREERPDVDQTYMTAIQLLTRRGGWPMSVWLLPDLRPFYGGTYFPANDYQDRPGFVSLLAGLEDAYRNRRAEVEASAEDITRAIGQLAEPAAPATAVTIDGDFIERMIGRSTSDYDRRHGGFGAAPKFPRQTLLELLLTYNRTHPSDRRMNEVRHALDAMAQGGIRDQLGGGFHRYSTDAEWLVPHFEIMLYDNAMLAWCYAEAYRQTEDRRYAAVARGIFDFVLREMTSPDGAFYTAFDAEVDACEGEPYLWTRADVEAALAAAGTDEGEIHRFCRTYGLDDGPNFADPHHGNGRPDKNVLFLAEPMGSKLPALLDPELAKLREILLAERKTRKQPLLDTKVITSWNGLMIRALAFGGQVLHDRAYVDAATRAADFMLTRHRTTDGGLFRTSRDGVAKYAGFLDDYAFTVQAMIALHDAGADERWKDAARALAAVMTTRFADGENGGFFFTEAGAADQIVRQKVGTDSPLPSGNGAAALALLGLDQSATAADTVALFAAVLEVQGEGMSTLLTAAVAYLRDHPPIVVEAGRRRAVPSPVEAAGGVVTTRTEWADARTLRVQLNVADGYHINAHDASSGLTATQLSVAGDAAIDGIDYPAGHEATFAFAAEPIQVYDGQVTVTVRFAADVVAGTAIELALAYQPCDDRACLPPVTRQIRAMA